MANKKKIMILDVEGMSNCCPYNIGYIIADKHGNIYQRESLAILPCIWENLLHCFAAKEMTHKNIEEILNDMENATNRKYLYTSIDEIKKKLLKDITANNIKEIWAYNCSFDKASLKRLFKDDFSIIENIVFFYDIIPAIVHTKLLNRKYVEWCNTHGFITQKGNVQVKAEIVYKYLTNNLDFVEEHTGLADCEIEYKILLFAIQTRKKLENSTIPPWRIFKAFCETNDIETVIPPNKETES